MNARLIIVSGLSGSGKSIVLHTLEDAGFYCIDNLPMFLMPPLAEQLGQPSTPLPHHVAVGIDARNRSGNLQQINDIRKQLQQQKTACELIFLTANSDILIRRFNETRRKHPLSNETCPLQEAIEKERLLLQPLQSGADLTVDSSHTNVHQLRDLIHARINKHEKASMSLMIQSFGFKHGPPQDADFMFDLRCLPNPHWQQELRPLTGRDQAVIDFLSQYRNVSDMIDHISQFLQHWIDCFIREGRSYLTIAIGCTGGQHRSVYVTEALGKRLQGLAPQVIVRHRELS
ncbi:MAG: RNase adapter RapZ [gamma proteobacterium symbiont of Bathyaustriella thionipta]|nr:RNase adapter RapZ [gamma proteobacterium symbiont of Bathyaustriella thionipta]